MASWPCWAWTPPSVLIPGLETSDSLDRNQLLPHHYSEHRSPPGLCAWSIAVHDCTATYSTNHIINFADDMTIRNLTTKVTSQHTGRRCIGYQVQSQQSVYERGQKRWLLTLEEHTISTLCWTLMAQFLYVIWWRTSSGLSTPTTVHSEESPAASLLSMKAEESSSPTPHTHHILQRDYRKHPEQLHHCLVQELTLHREFDWQAIWPIIKKPQNGIYCLNFLKTLKLCFIHKAGYTLEDFKTDFKHDLHPWTIITINCSWMKRNVPELKSCDRCH